MLTDLTTAGLVQHDVVWPFTGAQPVRSCRLIVGAVGAIVGLAADAIDDAQVIVSELATNALQHGCPPCELRLGAYSDRLVIEVVDGKVEQLTFPRFAAFPLPSQALAEPDECVLEGGRGLELICQLSQGHCGVEATTTLCERVPRMSKSVWAAIYK